MRDTLQLELIDTHFKDATEAEKQEAKDVLWALFDYYFSVYSELKESGYFDLPRDKRSAFDKLEE
nr:hypothetical protein [uncultured Roseateles sp.]